MFLNIPKTAFSDTLRLDQMFLNIPKTAFSDTLRLDQMFLNMAVTSFLPSQSAKRTSWKTNGDAAAASVKMTMTWVADAICGPLICRNSSFDRPSR